MGRLSTFAAVTTAFFLPVLTASAACGGARDGVSAFQRGQYGEALKHLAPAAEAGDAAAMFVLGKMYTSGTGVAKDHARAADFFHAAAERGHAEAQQSLGSALMLGDGIDQDMVEALKWFILSAHAGNKSAAAYAGNVAKFMSRDMHRDARSRARVWQQAFEAKNAAK